MQNIPCNAMRHFMEHVRRDINIQGSFEVTLNQWSLPNNSYNILVTNEAHTTYFCDCATWTDMVLNYDMEAIRKLLFFLEYAGEQTYFHYRHPGYS